MCVVFYITMASIQDYFVSVEVSTFIFKMFTTPMLKYHTKTPFQLEKTQLRCLIFTPIPIPYMVKVTLQSIKIGKDYKACLKVFISFLILLSKNLNFRTTLVHFRKTLFIRYMSLSVYFCTFSSFKSLIRQVKSLTCRIHLLIQLMNFQSLLVNYYTQSAHFFFILFPVFIFKQ